VCEAIDFEGTQSRGPRQEQRTGARIVVGGYNLQMLQTESCYIAERSQHFWIPGGWSEHNPQPPYAIDLWDNATSDPPLKVTLVEQMTFGRLV
jgi:hypothetical protein